jgi:phosphatidylinositol alpha-1,6-mannosyltransferase
MPALVLTEIFPPRIGGSGRWFWEIYRRLPREDYVIAAGQAPGHEEFDRTHTLRVERIPLFLPEWGVRSLAGLQGYWRSFRAVAAILPRYRIDHVHCGRCLPEGWIAWLLKLRYGLPYLCYMHGEETALTSSREHELMIRRVLAGAELIVANSRNTERMLHQRWGVPPGKVRLLYPGVDGARFVPGEWDGRVRDRLGWRDRRVVLTVGRLQRRKGHDQLILALDYVRKTVPDVLYAIAGAGEEYRRLAELVTARNLRSHVCFLGEVDDATLVECYQQCDLFVLPNRDDDRDIEGFGIVLLEAQACGKPVVAGASGGTYEAMLIPHTGRVVDCRGPEQLAALLIELLSQPQLLARMGRAARPWVIERFDWSSLIRQARDIFRENRESQKRAPHYLPSVRVGRR